MKRAPVILLLISAACHAQTGEGGAGTTLHADAASPAIIDTAGRAMPPDTADRQAYRIRAAAEDKRGDPAAISDYTAYIRLSGDSVQGCLWRAAAETHQKRFLAAIADCQAVLRIHPHLADAYAIRGEARYGLRQYRAAVADFDTVLRADSISFHSYYTHRSVAKYLLMDYAGAARDARRAAYFAKLYPPAPAAPATGPVADTLPQATHAVTLAVVPPPAKKSPPPAAPHPVAKAVPAKTFRNAWLDQYARDSILTQLRLSRAIAQQSDRGPLYAARGLIAHSQGRNEDACDDFLKAKELGYPEADDMMRAYCQ